MLPIFLLLCGTVSLSAQVSRSDSNIIWDTLAFPASDYGWEEGMTVPNLQMKDVHGNSFEFYSALDKVTVIDFWFIACKPCVANKRYLKSFYRQYDINLVSISVDQRASSVRSYAEENGLVWINIHDNNPMARRFKTRIGLDNSYPDYLVITPDKKVHRVFTSGSDIGILGVTLQELFREETSKHVEHR